MAKSKRKAKPAPGPGTSPMVERPVRDLADTRTHIERINPGDNPAYVPGALAGQAPGAPPPGKDLGPKRLYRLLEPAIHNDVRLPAGAAVELHDHQVGAHHELLPAPAPIAVPAKAKRRR